MNKYFISLDKLGTTEAIANVFLGSVQTENLTVAYTEMKAGTKIPLHHHREEAVDIVLQGLLEMQIGEKTGTVTTGMITIVPSDIPHQAKAISDCKVVTIFYPKRKL